jgi:hypothetical protein
VLNFEHLGLYILLFCLENLLYLLDMPLFYFL